MGLCKSYQKGVCCLRHLVFACQSAVNSKQVKYIYPSYGPSPWNPTLRKNKSLAGQTHLLWRRSFLLAIAQRAVYSRLCVEAYFYYLAIIITILSNSTQPLRDMTHLFFSALYSRGGPRMVEPSSNSEAKPGDEMQAGVGGEGYSPGPQWHCW